MTDDIFLKFITRGITHQDMLLLPPAAAREFLQECRANGIELLGFDGFQLSSDGGIEPIMDESIDLSEEPLCDLEYDVKLKFAEKFIEARIGRDIYFEMVVG